MLTNRLNRALSSDSPPTCPGHVRDPGPADARSGALTLGAGGIFCLASPADTYDEGETHAGSPGAAGRCGEAACDAVDDDCDGQVDEDLSDLDDDGACDALDCAPEEALCAEDCATDVDEDDVPDCVDGCLAVPEVCTGGGDEDCDGAVDSGCASGGGGGGAIVSLALLALALLTRRRRRGRLDV